MRNMFFTATLILMSAAAPGTVHGAELLARAVLPATTFAPGPTSGQFTAGSNGIATPFIHQQPVQGFSAVIDGPTKGSFLVMSDNGFGSKPTSPDALLRVFAVEPDFEAKSIVPINRFSGEKESSFSASTFITLRDPWRRIPFPIVADGTTYPGTSTSGSNIPVDPAIREQRLLTGADFDIESIRRAADGTLWFGDEFGPYLIHTDEHGRVLEAPIALPNFRQFPTAAGGTAVNPLVQSPSNPQLANAGDANLPNSGGFEGMALNESRTKLYALLEKPITGDPVRARLVISEFSLRQQAYTGKTFGYLMDAPENAIGDLTALSDHEYLLIERDNGQGVAADSRFTNPARFKKIFKIDLTQTDPSGNLRKQEVVDLMNIYDPKDIAGNGRDQTVFTFPFVTIEDVLVIDRNTLLVINDNNFPFSAGREFATPDDSEFILIHTAPLTEEKDCGKDWKRDSSDHCKREEH